MNATKCSFVSRFVGMALWPPLAAWAWAVAKRSVVSSKEAISAELLPIRRIRHERYALNDFHTNGLLLEFVEGTLLVNLDLRLGEKLE